MRRLLPLLALLAAVPSDAADPPKKKGTAYAFLVGVAGYDPEELKPIKGGETINDVLEFREALLDTGFDDANIVVMHDRQTDRLLLAEHDKILAKLKALLARADEADTVVVALSGHGVMFGGGTTGYFCPVDAKISTREKLIPVDGPGGLFDLLDGKRTENGREVPNCKAGTKLLIVNACRNDPASGSSLAGGKVELADEYPEAVPKGVALIQSCGPKQLSYFDPDRKRSVFFVHFTDAWRGKYQTAPGPLTVEAVFEQARDRTKNDPYLTAANRVQVPAVRRKYEGVWTVGDPTGANFIRTVPRPAFTDDQKKELRRLLAAGKQAIGGVKEARERVPALATVAALAHFSGDTDTADDYFDRAITEAKAGEWIYESELSVAANYLALCGRAKLADPLARLPNRLDSRDQMAASIVTGLAAAGEYRAAFDTASAIRGEKDAVGSALYRCFCTAREYGDLDTALGIARKLVQAHPFWASHLRWELWDYHTQGLAALDRLRGGEPFDLTCLKLCATIGNANDVASAFRTCLNPTGEERQLMRDHLPALAKLVDAEKGERRLSALNHLIHVALKVGDTDAARTATDAWEKHCRAEDKFKGNARDVAREWARHGDLELARRLGKLDPPLDEDHEHDLLGEYGCHLMSVGKVEDALAVMDKLPDDFNKEVAVKDLCLLGAKGTAAERVQKWVLDLPTDTDDRRATRRAGLELFAEAAAARGDLAELERWLERLPDEEFRPLRSTVTGLGRRLVQVGRPDDALALFEKRPATNSDKEFFEVNNRADILASGGFVRQAVDLVLAETVFSFTAARNVLDNTHRRNAVEDRLRKTKR